MRSLSPTFLHGWPALGLLLLRLLVGATVLAHAWGAMVHAMSSIAAWTSAALAIGAGVAVTIGCFTAVAAVLLSLGTFGVVCGWIPWSTTNPIEPSVSAIFLVIICVAIALLGPGAVSVDARLRGRRKIVIPRDAAKT